MIKLLLGLLGITGAVVAAGLLIGGGTLLWVDTAMTDSEGFINSKPMGLETETYAITTLAVEVEIEIPGPIDVGTVATVRISAENRDPEKGVFIGLAEVADLLRQGAHAFIRDNHGHTPFDEARRITNPQLRQQIIRTLALQGTEGNLECAICQENKARAEFAIFSPCLHSMCRECLQRMQQIIANAEQRQDTRRQGLREWDDGEDAAVIRRGLQCPICRHNIDYTL